MLMSDYMQYLEDINVKFSLLLPSKVPYKNGTLEEKILTIIKDNSKQMQAQTSVLVDRSNHFMKHLMKSIEETVKIECIGDRDMAIGRKKRSLKNK